MGAGYVLTPVRLFPPVGSVAALSREPLEALVLEEPLGSAYALSKGLTERSVLSPGLNVLGDRAANDLCKRLVVNGGYRFQRLGLLRREPDRHGFRCFHGTMIPD